MRQVLLALIRAYQRWLSPYKGFRCAYRVYTGRASCSTLGFRAVRRYGVRRGLRVIRQRLHLCGVAHRRHAALAPLHSQAGVIDCDLPSPSDCDMSCPDAACEIADCASCDWPGSSRKRSQRAAQADVYIPPQADQKYGPL